MKQRQKIAVLILLLFANLSLWAQKADDYRAAANRGDKIAQYNLGACYYNGYGVSQDYKQAVYWYTKAANRGFVEAQYNLGFCYYNGYGVTQDYKQAVYWYAKAANQGRVSAQYELGSCYEAGHGVTQDYKQAVYWYTKAANQGSVSAQLKLGNLYRVGAVVEKDLKLAKSMFVKVKGNPQATQFTKEVAEIGIKEIEREMAESGEISSSFNKQVGENSSSNTEGNAKVDWRTQMRKVFDNTTDNYSNGAYKGQKSNGLRHGLGAYWWNEGNNYYWGNYSNGLRHDYGINISGKDRIVANCSGCVYYVGNWSNNEKHGKGNCYDEEGNLIYSGDFSNGRPTGTYPSTEKYSRNKFECIEYDDGDKYVGETYNGHRHGYGIYLWKNGDAWYGPWKDGNRDGQGILLYYKGDNMMYGRWEKDTYYTN